MHAKFGIPITPQLRGLHAPELVPTQVTAAVLVTYIKHLAHKGFIDIL
jgi:hypothetical protein